METINLTSKEITLTPQKVMDIVVNYLIDKGEITKEDTEKKIFNHTSYVPFYRMIVKTNKGNKISHHDMSDIRFLIEPIKQKQIV